MAEAFGHRFSDASLLQRALTHRSHAGANNERLEFLGDALLNFVIGEALYHAQPQADEGALSRLRASLVREESLAELARSLALGDGLRLGEGELKSGGWRRDSVLADAFEAVLGAIYVDAGFAAAQRACLRVFAPLLQKLPDPESLKDPKTQLQEWLQARGHALPRYEVTAEEGPPHRRSFTVRCTVEELAICSEATASSRRGAQQGAAAQALEQLRGRDRGG